MQNELALVGAKSVGAFSRALVRADACARQYGLALTAADVQTLADKRTRALTETQRIEFFESAVPRIVEAFCDSPYLQQEEYVDTLCTLIDAFYAFKNEFGGWITDAELIAFMREQYDASGGSADAVIDASAAQLYRCRIFGEEFPSDV